MRQHPTLVLQNKGGGQKPPIKAPVVPSVNAPPVPKNEIEVVVIPPNAVAAKTPTPAAGPLR